MSRRAAMALALVALAPLLSHVGASAEVAKTATRTVQSSYSRAGGVTAATLRPELISPGPEQSSKSPEDRVRVTATDASGRTVGIYVEYQPKGQPPGASQVYCGASPTLSIALGSSLRVTPVAGTCPDGTPSVPTSGTIAFVFTRPVVPPTIAPAMRWAVLVGIQDYAGSTHSTFGARGDVNAARTALLHSGWRSDHIRTLVDGQASGQAVIDAMAWLAARSGPGTFSLFHFSGHVCISSRGGCPAGHTFLWSFDNRFIPEATVGDVLGRVQGRAWFDFAGCESGAFDVGLSSPKRLVTGSSQASETSYEQPQWRESVWGGLVWDQAFLQGRAGAKAGRATIGQMVAYGKAQAPQVTANQAAGPQHPYVAGGDPTQSLYAPRP
ncbi:MAG: peptidase caspase catalytic subunit p20 [Frankiales bacterium]|nr:peptidase caspase catalytic subunit p20 [Frankiales bacterium]